MRARLTVVATVLVLAATGCSGGGAAEPEADPPASTGEPAPSGSSGPEPSGTATPEATEPVDPCDLVGKSTWTPLVEREYRAVSAQRRTFDLIVPGMYTCRVSGRVSDLLRVSFGYALGPVDWQALRRRTKPDGFVERTPLAAIGDEAFYTTGLGGIEAYARTGEYVVAVTVTGPTTVSDLGLLLNRLVLAAEPGWHDHPIVLPDGCPAAEDAAVTGLLGTVTYARGGFYRVPGVTTRQAFCHYVNERGELAAVDVEEHRKDYPGVVDLILDTTDRIVDPPPGRVRSLSRGSDGAWSSQTGLPESGLWVIVSTWRNNLTGTRFRGSERAYLRFTDRVEQDLARGFRDWGTG